MTRSVLILTILFCARAVAAQVPDAGKEVPNAGAEARATEVPDAGAEARATEVPNAGAEARATDVANAGAEARATDAPAPKSQSLAQLKSGDIQQDLAGRGMSFVGVFAMIGLAWLASENRRRVPWRLVAMGTVLQLVFAALILKTGAGRLVFEKANDAVTALLAFSEQGARFVFGNLVDLSVPAGAPLFEPGSASPVLQPQFWAFTGSIIAFRILPTILFFSALMAVLYHVGLMQLAVKGVAWVMQRTMKTSGAETLSAAGNIFLGQTEAPLLVKPYLDKMTRSELMAIMAAGFATTAGGVLAAYVGMLSSTFPDIAGHLLACSVMGAPAALVMAKIMVPETEPLDPAEAPGGIKMAKVDANVIDALTRGTSEGTILAFNVGAMLITFIAMVAVINAIIGGVGGLVGFEGLSLETIFGWIGAPLAFILGVPWDDARTVGSLLATKTVLNEFVAYQQMAGVLEKSGFVHAKSAVIASYALCGFSNFGSIGIQIGGIAAMAPSRRGDLARLGMMAMLCGSLATFQTAAIAGLFL
jgi:concentrative nucleoside transporter, CNT family